MNTLRSSLAAALILVGCVLAHAQTSPVSTTAAKAQAADYDVFVPIAKYLSQGNAEAISAWFADNLEMSVLSKGGNSSRGQARQILKTFFDTYTPRSFQITYTAGRGGMKYALGTLNAGGENFLVTIFVSSKGEAYTIQQLKIERIK
ncbi:MAG: DUF4783 domain-containing protein [Bacteroidales bacterium]|nr:DUF4783 domain-containing protein [Bacteroidales bacterium]